MKIIVIGNCHARGMVDCLQLSLGDEQCVEARSAEAQINDLANDDVVLLQTPFRRYREKFEASPARVVQWPTITFRAFHPDITILRSGATSPLGGWHSSICLAAWKLGLSIDQAVSLFRPEVFESLDFFRQLHPAQSWLTSVLDEVNYPGNQLVERWLETGCFMYGMNHPKMHVVADLARIAAEQLALPIHLRDPASLLNDPLKLSAIWPVYPAIASRLGLPKSEFVFKAPVSPKNGKVAIYDLETFVAESYRIYSESAPNALDTPQLEKPNFKELDKKVRAQTRTPNGETADSPYKGLPDFQFWRRSIERMPAIEVDPVVSGVFKIYPSEKVATAGSCFAQHISRTLASCGFNYYVAEQAPREMTADDALARNYGVFSARFGNIYTARQLRQLFESAFGKGFHPVDRAWIRPDGRYVDPFRPAIEPSGYDSLDEVEKARTRHLSHVRRMFEELDVFVFTLGLTEGWRSKIDGAVYPLAPGVAGGHYDPASHEFINFTVRETVEDMDSFIKGLRSVNPDARIVLTVSPVPLIATYEPRHVLVSTTYSKSVLRAAAEEIVTGKDYATYFPSYEIITGNFNKGAYFEPDQRSIRKEGVDHVMSLFLRHYTSTAKPVMGHSDDGSFDELRRLSDVICDEQLIDR